MEENKDLKKYTREEFLAIENHDPVGFFDDVIIVPTDLMHDSGFLCMKFIFVRQGLIVGAASGCSDVLHLNGIGGYGKPGFQFQYSLEKGMTKLVGWRIDVLPKSGCVRLMCDHPLSADYMAVSDYSIFIED